MFESFSDYQRCSYVSSHMSYNILQDRGLQDRYNSSNFVGKPVIRAFSVSGSFLVTQLIREKIELEHRASESDSLTLCCPIYFERRQDHQQVVADLDINGSLFQFPLIAFYNEVMKTYKNFNIMICGPIFGFLQFELQGCLQSTTLLLGLGNCLWCEQSLCAV